MEIQKNSRAFKCKLAFLCVFLAVISCLFSIEFAADATGSRNLTSTQQPDGSWISNTGYRPYTEWYGASTAGIPRHQILKVYVNAEEMLYFGSSVANGAGGDIVVRKPDGSVVPAAQLDVNAVNGTGYIDTRAKELAGPNCPGGNPAGYTPLSITVDQTGIWEFEFHSVNNDQGNPAPALTTAVPFASQGTGTVAAWDITVVKIVDASPAIVPGRVFTNFLSLNMGNNFNGADGLEAKVYVLTKDGYVYQTNFNGMDPYGFIFFANNRGLINSNTNTSLYQSGVGTDNNMLPITSKGIPVQFQSPINPDTTLDSTFKIFFEVPSSDLPADIQPVPYAPGSITNFKFVGYSNDHGYVGVGGYFYFTVTKATSFQIKLDFTGLNGGIVYLANSCVEGVNRIFWDGKDGKGNDVPANTYDGKNNNIVITITAKSGEYHFPMLDVENNRNGISITMLSNPLDSNNQPSVVLPAEKTTVYYNNTSVPGITNIASQNKLEGMDSTSGASIFANNTGDFSALDLWTYYKASATQVAANIEPFVLEAPANKTNIKGFVFYDNNHDGIYSMLANDYAMPGITVELWNNSNNKKPVFLETTITDATGNYSFTNIAYTNNNNSHGDYLVRVAYPYTYPYTIATCTTGHLDQTKTINSDVWTDMLDVGFNYAKTDKKITVKKSWTISKASDASQPASVTVHLFGKNGAVTEITRDVVLSGANGWKYTYTELPKYASNETTLLVYSVTEDAISGYAPPNITTTSTSSETIYTITNTPKGRIALTKVDSDNPALTLGGAQFELWKKGPTDTWIKTQTTNAAGTILFTDLAEGTYYFKEIAAPAGYTLDAAHSISADILIEATAANYSKSITVTNTRRCSFTLTKTISAASNKDEQFLFEITGPAGAVYYSVITIPTGQVTVSQKFVDMPVGTYNIIEKNSNWRYTIVTASSQASNGTTTFSYADGKLSMLVDDSLNVNYRFTFTDSKTVNIWVSGHSNVTNTMK